MTCTYCGGTEFTKRYNYNCKKMHDVCQDTTCNGHVCEGVSHTNDDDATHGTV